MTITKDFIKPMTWQGDSIKLLNQQKLPGEIEFIFLTTIEQVWESIHSLKVRGAPAIGITAAYGLALWGLQSDYTSEEDFRKELLEKVNYLVSSRPTAVNLYWALNRLVQSVQAVHGVEEIKSVLVNEAILIQQEDEQTCRAIGEYGFSLFPESATVLTHCNTGGIATSKYGTALGAFYIAKEKGAELSVYATETRPVLQGARLTAWELQQAGVDVTLITDNMAAHVLQSKNVDAVIVGADRIAANGDTANKIGTLGLAHLAKAFNIPFYVAAPFSTIDLAIQDGREIPIEERSSEEITHIAGTRVAPENVNVYNPAFDVTPNELITAIITEKGIVKGNYAEELKRVKELV
ncbi:S-methyl-5-thioribose-1-phosphate isomerase [Jeotgalibacillus proteolyticus]|uniref:Methylthioribose-1-phosphate isomerase n=1 Tax=Jeotgalibacillus proteolyticus TaxID=2082395 RepID=A0A2S5GA25_9BACL|nr:S-methyl-5-thioribose-1-phosphate isomerase [Jeotgalibacillus proteolyticus]PPA69862.1 S-methyl-5-thioribose-1-phosphate isomerase [Jeotgalibacillus proteolyticus]